MTEPVFDLAWIGAIVGFFLPLIISAVKRASWSTQTKRILALATSAIAGLVTVGAQAGWDLTPVAEFAQLAVFSIMQIYVAASVVYRSFWEDTAVEQVLESIGS